MTVADRTAAVAAHGFTPRQAAFLTHRHAARWSVRAAAVHGLCPHRVRPEHPRILRAPDATGASPPRTPAGAVPRASTTSTTRRSIAPSASRTTGTAGRRHVARAVERLMVLDVVLGDPETTWLGTEREKVAYFTERHGLSADELAGAGLQPAGRPDRPVLPREAADWTRRERGSRLRLPRDRCHRARLPRVPRRVTVGCSSASTAGPSGWCSRRHRSVRRACTRASWPSVWPRLLRPAVADEFRWFCQVRRASEDGRRPQ